MKKHLLAIFILFVGFSVRAEFKSYNSTTDSFDEMSFKDNQIKVLGKYKGKFNVLVKDINVNSKEKTTVYEVSIFNENGDIVALLDLQVQDKTKKNCINVVEASLKTLKDNATHNSSNFINYQKIEDNNSKNFEVPQFDNVIKYLISYNYF